MLSKIDLTAKMKKKEAKPIIEALQNEMIVLQQRMKELSIPMIVLFEGWDCSGKGTHINKFVNELDTRAYTVYSISPPDEGEMRKPTAWRFWQKIPVYGKLSVFDESWYQWMVWEEFAKHVTRDEQEEHLEEINEFERQLVDDGCVIVKLFLHISKEEQRKRQETQLQMRAFSWQVTRLDLWQNRNYDQFKEIFDRVLKRTDTEWAPWHPISSMDLHLAQVEFMTIIRDAMKDAVEKKERGEFRVDVDVPNRFKLVKTPKLSEVRLDRALTDEEYKEERKEIGMRLSVLHNYLYKHKIPLIILYEGWDAGGKGGNIRRVTQYLDPRGYQVIPTAAPDFVEKNHQYLWRFWRNLPKSGHIAIFDRTWYGRVMVERVEGFAREDEWQRAYREINEFEAALDNWGAIIVKFWIQIDQEEQLRRFTARQENPDKQWKITDEDWRNREKWPAYEIAVNDMLKKTSTDFAPWTIIEGNDKKYARIKAMKTIVEAIEKRLKH